MLGKSYAHTNVAPLSLSELKTSVEPNFSMARDGTSITVRRTEYVGDISSVGTDYKLHTYVLTPTNTTLFPWLSGIAARYESYSFNSVKIHYCPTAPATTPGMVGLAAEFDASDADPTNKHEFLNIVPADRASVWSGQSINLSRKDLNVLTGENGARYCGNPKTNADLIPEADAGDAHTTLAGRVYLMMQDVPVGVAGEIWAEYDVSLKIPDYAPPCDVPLRTAARWTAAGASGAIWSAYILDPTFGTIDNISEGISFLNNSPANGMEMVQPEKYYSYTFYLSGAVGQFTGANNITASVVHPDSRSVGYHGSWRSNQASHALATKMNFTGVLRTKSVIDGGPTRGNPALTTVDISGVWSGTAIAGGVTIQEIDKIQYDLFTIYHSSPSEHKSGHPPSPSQLEGDDWDAISHNSSEPPSHNGWVRASQVLGLSQ